MSNEFPCFHADPAQLESRYLALYFAQESAWTEALGLSTGGTPTSRNRLKEEQFLAMRLPLPPLPEQRRIVARVEALAGRIAEAKRLREEAKKATHALTKAAARALIGECPSPKWIPLHRYVEEIENGWSPACESRPASDGEWGVLKVGAVSFGQFDAKENKALPPALAPKPEFEIQAGDFLMSRANTTALAGACAVVRKTRPRLILCDKIFRFRFRDNRLVDRFWLDYVLKSPALRTQIERAATGTSSTMKNISKGKVLELLIPPHSPEEQRRGVEELNAIGARASTVQTLQAETAAELDALLPAVLSQAFAGKL